ncbi:MAG: MBL fold metallo-hydrolase, partial [Candidatus Lokiarchaeota archaeon]|nr:MBL fold metallo-hydrolase [Candidatus Lokiarchaeota archaeon]
KQFKIGGFTILPLEAKHDIHCLSFLIQHEDIGKLFFITDSYYCLYKFNGLNHILIEANYSEKILERNNINETIKERLLKSHFSLENAKKFVKANDNPKLKNIVLLHLSDSNSNAKEFKGVMEELTHKRVEIADKGLEIELNK